MKPDDIQERFAGYIRAVEKLRIEDWVIDGDEAIMWEKDDNYPVKSFKYRDDPAALTDGARDTLRIGLLTAMKRSCGRKMTTIQLSPSNIETIQPLLLTEPETPSILDRSFDEVRKPRADDLTSDEQRLIDEAIAQGRVRKLPMTEPRHEKPKRNMLGRKPRWRNRAHIELAAMAKKKRRTLDE